MFTIQDPTSRHPPLDVLEAFDHGHLPAEDSKEVEAHLLDCTACCETLAALPADAFLSQLRDAYSAAVSRPPRSSFAATTPAPTVALACLPVSPLPGTPTLAGFEDVRELGRGGMGVVYAATHRVMGRRVAVKLIHPEFAANVEAVERFRREARAVARLKHPHLVTAFDAGQDGDRPFLVMEYLDGESLADLVARDGPLPITEACNCIRQAAMGLQFAHDNGLIHRDVKPHNLMRTTDGTVKVLDFGLAALANDGGRIERGTGPNAVMGTPDYMAPEQAEDARSADGRADVYGLGCTLFHLLTGKEPFPMESTLLKLLAHRTQERPSAKATRSEVPAQLDAVLHKAMARQPKERYSTPREFAEALEPFADPSCIARLARKNRRRSLTALAALLLAAATVAAGVTRLPAGKDREIVIETDDAQVEVIIKGDRIVRIVDPKTGRAYRLDREELTISLVDEPDGLAVTLDGKSPIVLKRNGKRIATVRVETAAKSGPPPKVAEKSPEHPFNGKDLTGWVVDGGKPGSWYVEDGELVGAAAKYPDIGWLLTERSYSNFRMRFEYQVSAGANSGVGLRAVPGERYDRNNLFASHLEVQILDDGACRKPDGSIPCPTGTLFSATVDDSYVRPDRLADLKPQGSWNEMIVESHGGSLQTWVNGRRILNVDLDHLANQSNARPALQRSSGRIGFQRHTGSVRFRKIEIKELPLPEKVIEVLRLHRDGQVNSSVDLSPDGRLAVAGYWGSACVLEVATGKELHVLAGWLGQFTPDGKRIVTCGKCLRVYDSQSGKLLVQSAPYEGVRRSADPEGCYFGLTVLSDGRRARTSSDDQRTRLWDLETGELLHSWRFGQDPPPGALDSDPAYGANCRGQRQLEASANGTVIVKDRASGKEIARMSAVSFVPNVLSISQDGRFAAACAHNQASGLVIWRLKEPPLSAKVGEKPDRHFFNGKDLTGWVGLPGYWYAEDGAIVGKPLGGRAAHTFLVSEKRYKDFDLKFQVRRRDGIGNSGVQFRSRIADLEKYTVVGPQCEIDSAEFSFPPGSLVTEPDCKPLRERSPRTAIAARYKNEGFNDFHIRCIGKHVTITVNGVTAIDDDYPDLPDEGVIAWQLHGWWPPNEVMFRNIEFTDLSDGFKPLQLSKNLSGWFLEGDEGRFRTEGAVLVASSPDWKARGYLLSEKQYENYRLRFDCKLAEKANSGIVIRGYRGERSDFEKSGAIDHPVIKLTDASAHPNLPSGSTHWVMSGSHTGPFLWPIDFPIDEWNTVEIEVKGTTCQMWVNKALAVRLKLDEPNRSGQLLAGLARAKGHLGFQANVGTARFRNVEIKELPASE